MPSDLEKKIPEQATTPSITDEGGSSAVIAEAALPKLVVCFDINTLSLQDLQTIASDLRVPGYIHMDKEQLCEALLALSAADLP